MKTTKHFLKDWQRNSDFYPELRLLISIKSFDLAAIRQRYLASRNNAVAKGGSVERRAVSLGGLAQLALKGGQAQVEELIENLKEPRGLSAVGDRLAFSLENTVIVIDSAGMHHFSDPWFSYIHTVSFHPQDHRKVLVSSSGFDALFEYDYATGEKTWEWFAWENGLFEGHSKTGESILLTRQIEQHQIWEKEGRAHLYISDPLTEHLPTAQRAAFINTASYDAQARIMATLFHEGSVREIDPETGASEIKMQGLKNPHGGFKLGPHQFMATNTGRGELWLQTDQEIQIFSGAGLAHKAPEMGDAEWWQNAVRYGDYYLIIDSNRNAILILDPKHQRYDQIAFDSNWAVQDLVVLSGQEPEYGDFLASMGAR